MRSGLCACGTSMGRVSGERTARCGRYVASARGRGARKRQRASLWEAGTRVPRVGSAGVERARGARAGSGRWRAASCSAACGARQGGKGGGIEKEKEKKKEKEKGREKKKRERKRDRPVDLAAATAAGRACALVGRDARDAGEQGVGTAMDSDVGTGFLGVREIGQGTILNGLSSTIEKRF